MTPDERYAQFVDHVAHCDGKTWCPECQRLLMAWGAEDTRVAKQLPHGERFQFVWWWRARWWKPWFFRGGRWPYYGPNAGRIYRDRFGFWVLEIRVWA